MCLCHLLRVQCVIPPLLCFLTLPLDLYCCSLNICDLSYEMILSEHNLDRRSSATPLAQLESNRIDSDYREPSKCVLAAADYLRLVIMVGKMRVPGPQMVRLNHGSNTWCIWYCMMLQYR